MARVNPAGWHIGLCIFADFMKVICNLHFIQLQITCNIVIEIQLQLLDLKCNSITITITELVIQLRNSITCISITEQHWSRYTLDSWHCTRAAAELRSWTWWIKSLLMQQPHVDGHQQNKQCWKLSLTEPAIGRILKTCTWTVCQQYT